MNNIKDTKKHPILTIQCCTYNHASYIKQCLDGFVMQQTTFPFVAIVIDDASVDNEPQVLWDFINQELDSSVMEKEETEDYVRVMAPHKVNMKCTFDIFFLKYNHYSIQKSKASYLSKWNSQTKYIALCEGDDYWIDSFKLEKQVSILEKYPECSMVVSSCYDYICDKDLLVLMNPIPTQESRFLTMKEVLREEGGLIPTASMCLRRELYETRPISFLTPHVGDRPLRLWCVTNGPIYYIHTPMTVYRVSSVGSFSQRSNSDVKYANDVYETMIRFFDYFDNYTHFSYHDDVEYMKEREKYIYYQRINDKRRFYCKHYKEKYCRSMSIKDHIKLRIKYLLNDFPHALCLLKKITNRVSLYLFVSIAVSL